jgi:hypothetical protein
MSAVLFPYPTLGDSEPTLSITTVRLDGASRPHLVKKEDSTISLYDDAKPWRRAELDFELICVSDRVRAFEDEHGRISGAVLVANCRPTNARHSVRMSRSDVDRGRWSGTLELDRENVRDRVDLTTILSAEVGGVTNRPVAVAPGWIAYADEPESLRLKGTLRVRWLNFTSLASPVLARAFPHSTHLVHFTSGMPELWLNSGFAGLEPLLKDRKDRRGADKALHDFQRTGIARGAWLALIADAMSAVQGDAADEQSDELGWPEKPWQAEILKRVLPQVAPDKSERELLTMAAQAWREGCGDFFARAEAVVGDIVKANESIRRYVQSHRVEE